MLIQFTGRTMATPSAMTVLFDGTEIFSGQVGSGIPLNTLVNLLTYEWAQATLGQNASITVSVTSGIVTIGSVGWDPAELPPADSRISSTILINGLAPEWPAEGTQPRMPFGTPENPDWSYWEFEIGAGETITFDIEDIFPEGSSGSEG
jgi:hypothetical protein